MDPDGDEVNTASPQPPGSLEDDSIIDLRNRLTRATSCAPSAPRTASRPWPQLTPWPSPKNSTPTPTYTYTNDGANLQI